MILKLPKFVPGAFGNAWLRFDPKPQAAEVFEAVPKLAHVLCQMVAHSRGRLEIRFRSSSHLITESLAEDELA
jgi:hypothetical protein